MSHNDHLQTQTHVYYKHKGDPSILDEEVVKKGQEGGLMAHGDRKTHSSRITCSSTTSPTVYECLWSTVHKNMSVEQCDGTLIDGMSLLYIYIYVI